MKKLTYEYVKGYIESFDYVLLSKEYVNAGSKLILKCPNGHVTNTLTWNSFQQGRRCCVCANNVAHTNEIIDKKLKEEGYMLVSGDYKNNKSVLLIRCPNGHEYKISWNNFVGGDRCAKCRGTEKYHNRYSYNEVKEYIENFEYQLLSEEEVYGDVLSSIQLRCPFGHEYQTNFNNFKNNKTRCPYCAGVIKYTYKEVEAYIESFGYKLLSKEYTNCNTHIEIECPKGHNYFVTFSKFKNVGRRCPVCCASKGEERIGSYLNSKCIEYIYEKTFEDLLGTGGGNLSYDFYLPNCNLLIEYQGEQHEKSIKHFGGKGKLEIQQEHDKRKREYAEKNNMDLLEIWYWEFDNIENILDEVLKNGK